MTPQEKWDRMNNPTCLEDYGLSMTESEALQVPEGRIWVEAIRGIQNDQAIFRNRCIAMGKASAKILHKRLFGD